MTTCEDCGADTPDLRECPYCGEGELCGPCASHCAMIDVEIHRDDEEILNDVDEG